MVYIQEIPCFAGTPAKSPYQEECCFQAIRLGKGYESCKNSMNCFNSRDRSQFFLISAVFSDCYSL